MAVFETNLNKEEGAKMRVRNIELPCISGASGVEGFFGEGYWFHKWLKRFRILNMKGLGFTAKTVTAHPRLGNMRLKRDLTPEERFPACIKVNYRKGLMLNAVSLSNAGIVNTLGRGEWQKRNEPFMLSVMPTAETKLGRMDEMCVVANILTHNRRTFSAPFALQVNLSCPNTGHDGKEMLQEATDIIEILQTIGVPLIPKFSIATASPEAVMEIAEHPSVDAICVSNTIPFGWQGLNWDVVWGSSTSPLKHLGGSGGGLSGSILCSFVCEWIAKIRSLGFKKPIHGGGGIMSSREVEWYHQVGASSVFIGSVVALRPWRVTSIIRTAQSLNWS